MLILTQHDNKSLPEKEKLLTRISNHLIINSSFISDLSLYHGKMGIVLFFTHYARYTGKTVFDDFAGELLSEIFEEIHSDIPVNFEEGLCGIGWGIQYLLQNNFMEGDPDIVLRDLDNGIMERDILNITDNSFETGLAGISFYVQSRLMYKRNNHKKMPFNKKYLDNVRKVSSDIKEIIPENILSEILKYSSESDDIHLISLGLNKGCAGTGLKLILR